MRLKLQNLLLLGVLLSFAACKKENMGTGAGTGTTTTGGSSTKIAPDGFNFATTKDVTLSITLKSNNDVALAGVILSVYAPGTSDSSPSPAIFKGVSDKNGVITGKLTVPVVYSGLVLDPAYVGLSRYLNANINNNAVTATIGGKAGFSGDIVAAAISPSSTSSTSLFSLRGPGVNSASVTEFAYPSPYTSTANAVASPISAGVPNYLDATNDVISSSLLSYINASLPENSAVPDKHPQYISNTAVNVVNITATTDLYVTFVSEGAGYYNTLGWYSYPTSNPPSATSGGTNNDGINKLTMIFPNASGSGSGGSLTSGNRVKIGNFTAGTTVAFVLLQNAWTSITSNNTTTYGINTAATRFYSQDVLNPEANALLKRHNVLLYDDVNNLFLSGFEDISRDANSGSDNDFNDLIFYVKSSVANAISKTNVELIDKGGDADGDGVADSYDAFPNDAIRAYVSYYPSSSTYAQLAFEDNWPTKGDYDLNDLVLNYRYTLVFNAQGGMVDLTGEYNCAAVGASFKNGFGVQLPFPASSVASVTGQKITGSTITLASNGVEAGQANAVIIPFDNTDAMIKNLDGAFFVNTLLAKDKVVNGNTATVKVTFTSPINTSSLSIASINPFLISNQRRGYEIHLPGYAATDKATAALFNTGDDNSAITKYVSKDNWPWAISYLGTFNYPIEGTAVSVAYPHFLDWAGSAGGSYTDWYSNTSAGYRNTAVIYNK